MSTASGGLAGVVAGQTAVCEVTQTSLRYRGYEIADLAKHCRFEETAHLLLHGELPTRTELESFRGRVIEAMRVPADVDRWLQTVPAAVPPMDVLRSAVSLLGHGDPDRDDNGPEANLRKSERLLGQLAAVVGRRNRLVHGLPDAKVDPSAPHAANLLRLLTGREPGDAESHWMDVSLTLYAEHEFNASTFAARVITSTLSDLHGAIVGAIAALKGPLHGGANEAAMAMLLEIGSPGRAERFVRDAFVTKRKLMGFGHRVYKHGDHRAQILEEGARELCAAAGKSDLTRIAEIVAGIMQGEKKIHPNLDWPTARVYHAMGLPTEIFTPIFVASRVTGWCAHVMEQFADNRLIRPGSEYVGPPPREIVPIDRR